MQILKTVQDQRQSSQLLRDGSFLNGRLPIVGTSKHNARLECACLSAVASAKEDPC